MKNLKASFWKKSLFVTICLLGMHQPCNALSSNASNASGATPPSGTGILSVLASYLSAAAHSSDSQVQRFMDPKYHNNTVPPFISGTAHTSIGKLLFAANPTEEVDLAQLDDNDSDTYPVVRSMLCLTSSKARGKMSQSDISTYLDLREKIRGAIIARKAQNYTKTCSYFISDMLINQGVTLKQLEDFRKAVSNLEDTIAKEEIDAAKDKHDQDAKDRDNTRQLALIEANKLADVAKQKYKSQQKREAKALDAKMKLNQAVIDAQTQKEGMIQSVIEQGKNEINKVQERTKQITQFVTNPLILGAGITFFGSIIILIYLAKYGLKRLFTSPPDFMKTSLPTTFWQRWFPYFFPTDTLPIENIKGIYNADVQKKLDKIFSENKKILEAQEKGHNVYFKNYLFWGPPGTGKTLFAKVLAQGDNPDNPDFYYVLIPGNSILQLPIQDALRAITDILSYARKNSMGKPVIFIYDEADALFRARATADEATRKIVNLWLASVPKALSEDEMHIFITNQPSVMDPAVIDRAGTSVYIGKPNPETAYKIVKAYLYQAGEEHNITISKEIKQNQEEIGEACEGLVGRNLELIVQSIMDSLLLEGKSKLSMETLLDAIKDYKKSMKDLYDPTLDPLGAQQDPLRNNNVPVAG